MNAPYVFSLNDASQQGDASLSAVGGKALNLARLYRAGFSVPTAFFLTTAAYELSQGIFERLAAGDPSNAGWHRDLGISNERIGDIKTAQGQLAEALAAYQRKFELIDALAAADPSNASWQRDLGVSHFKIGAVAQQQGRGDLVRSHWGAMLAIFDALDRQGLHISPSDRMALEEIRRQVAALEGNGDLPDTETP